ncbi:MAG: phosphoribosylanthranilate isomerase [Erythrobacter sp.]|jgi:phosphoribosylanthranilate isomerase|nr:phosphoribosylanthranilate isomerase [Erythrobacter sp.]
MTAPLIKICGLSSPETIAAAANSGASHIGLVHFPRSPRHVDLDAGARLRGAVPREVKTVVLVVDPDGLTLANLVNALRPDIIQFHGQEPAQALAMVKQSTGLEVWKALPVKDRASLEAGAAYAGIADRLLYDAPAPKGSALPGGNGEAFGWDVLAGHRHAAPWGLAGGLTPANVAEAVRQTGAPLVDVSSGVERAPGIKDVDKIVAFCKAARL